MLFAALQESIKFCFGQRARAAVKSDIGAVLEALLSYQPSFPSVDFSGVSADSRRIQPGWIFVVIRGHFVDGSDFIQEALARGASLVVSEDHIPNVEPLLIVQNARLAHAIIAAGYNRHILGENRAIRFAAVTGTDGKTSTVHYMTGIMRNHGLRVGSIGSMGVNTEGTWRKDGSLLNNTPDPETLFKILNDFQNNNVDHVCIEASSQGLAQCRLDGLTFDVAAFTNLSADHLEYHGCEESYFAAKMRLFNELMSEDGVVVVNVDDARSERIIDSKKRVITYGSTENATVRLLNFSIGKGIELEIMNNHIASNVSLPAEFGAYNIMCAIGISLALGLTVHDVAEALHTLPAPGGRMEILGYLRDSPIILDYAHTPNAMAKVLKALRARDKNSSGRIITVFGCGGERDRGKRRAMGEVACALADVVILADDNPRREDPASIRKDIMAGCPDAYNVGNRREAIELGCNMLVDGDILLLAGKGIEQSQIFGDIEIPYNDTDTVRDILARHHSFTE